MPDNDGGFTRLDSADNADSGGFKRLAAPAVEWGDPVEGFRRIGSALRTGAQAVNTGIQKLNEHLGIPQGEIKSATTGETVFPTNPLERAIQRSSEPAKEVAAGVIGPGAKGGPPPFGMQPRGPMRSPLQQFAPRSGPPGAPPPSQPPPPGAPPPGAGAPPPKQPTASPQFVQAQSDALFRLRQTITADKQEMSQRLDAVPETFRTPEMQEKFYNHAEDPKNNPLNPQEKQVFDQFVEPLRTEAAQLYADIKGKGYPVVDNSEYMHRVRKGREPAASPVDAHHELPQMGTRSLPRTTSALQERSYYALEDPQTGRRTVVTPGKDSMLVWNQGKHTSVPIGDEIKPGNVVTHNGKNFNVVQATTKEIEANTPERYHKNATVNMADTVVRLRAVKRNIEHLENLKQTPEFQNIATEDKFKAPPHWVGTKLPQLEGWRMDPKIAHVFDDFYKPGLGDGELLEGLRKINRFAVGSMFWNPTPHIENVMAHWFVSRGWDNFTPKGLKSLYNNGARAIKAVSTQNKDYQDLLKNGSGLIYGGVANRDFYGAMAKKFGMEMEKDPARWGPIAAKLGFNKIADMTAAFYNQMNKTLWWANDAFMLQRVYELEGKGYSRVQAIKEAEKHIPNYRIPTEIMGSRKFSELMQDPGITAFGRYHYGMWKSYTNMIADLVKGDPQKRFEAIGNMMALGVLSFGIYPMIDYALHKLTGNEDLRKMRRGAASIPDQVYKLATGDRSFYDFLGNVITMAPAFKEGLQQFTNRDFWSGKNISEPTDERKGRAGRVIAEKAEHAMGALVAPYSLLQRQQKDADEKGIPRQLADQLIGIEDRTKTSRAKQARAQRYQARGAARRKPAGPIEAGERLLERMYGGTRE